MVAASALVAAAATIVVVPAGSALVAQNSNDGDLPGNGQVVRVARPTWDTGWFQAEIASQLLGELGYVIEGPSTMENADFYAGVARGDVDLWVNGWFPLHDDFVSDSPTVSAIGFEVQGGALQGYLADRETVEQLGIESLSDLGDPQIAAVFDRDGDGAADLIGCNRGWACQPIIEQHLLAEGLAETVEQVSGDYGPLMLDTVHRFTTGQPVLFYTFTPNWTTGALRPGTDVVWLPLGDQETATSITSVPGCRPQPCDLGFAPNDIRAVANNNFLALQPAIESLLTTLEIPLEDISNQNVKMIEGEDSARAIASHASQWIESNRHIVDDWLLEAIEQHVAGGLPLAPPPTITTSTPVELGKLRVVTRVAPPFVTYEDVAYGGFSIELLELLAEDVGADLEIYGVNSSAKMIDDITRGSADIGVGAISITAEREQLVDFSQPYFDAGLQILVSDRSDGFTGGRFRSVAGALLSRDLLVLLLVLLGLLVLAAHAIWFAERRHNPDFPQSYRAGIWDALWWAAVTATTVGYGDKTPKGRVGRLFGLLWMFSGLFVLAYFTAGIATTFTIDELSNQIESPNDLRGHAVAVPQDSDAADYLDLQGIPATSYVTPDDAYIALRSGEVDAVVHNAAILQHLLTTDDGAGVRIAGSAFAERGFGLVVASDSELAESLNKALLTLTESEAFEDLRESWFGHGPDSGG